MPFSDKENNQEFLFPVFFAPEGRFFSIKRPGANGGISKIAYQA